MKKKKYGFTLLEVLIVVIIIGILATLAIPQFFKAVNKARKAEAFMVLGTMRSAMIRYYQVLNVQTYVGLGPSNLDVEIPGYGIPVSNYWTYTIEGQTATTATARASGKAGTAVAGLNIYEDANGTMTGDVQ